MKKLTIGQRIDIYKVLNDGGYKGGEMIPETHRAVEIGTINDGITGYVELIANNQKDPLAMLTGVNAECKKIGTMVIKSVK